MCIIFKRLLEAVKLSGRGGMPVRYYKHPVNLQKKASLLAPNISMLTGICEVIKQGKCLGRPYC